MGEQRQDRQALMPADEAFLESLHRRHRRAGRWRIFFFASMIVGLMALLALFINVVDEAFGTVAIASEHSEAEVLAALSEATGTDVGASLEALDNDSLAQVLALYIPRRLGAIVRDELSVVAAEDFTRVPLREALAGATLPADVADMTISQLSTEQVTAILSANLAHDDLYAHVVSDVIGLDILKSWTLSRTLFDYAGIEAEFEALVAKEEPPNPELKPHSWLNAAFVSNAQSSYPELAGVRTAILGTLWIMALTIIIAFPLGLGAAIYLEEYARSGNWLEKIIETNIRNLAGVPSIIYGLLGLAIFVRALAPISSGALFGVSDSNGRTILSAALTMALLILPVIIIAAQEAIRAVPQSIREASYGLGATQWQTIWRVVVPAAKSGILTAVMLGMGRAIGETMAVMMVTGNAARMPITIDSLVRPVRTMTATVAAEMGEVAQGSTHYHALFGIGIALFVLTFLINLAAASAIFQKRRRGGLR